MAADERNFRSAYYEKVASRNVEEKKSLDIILKEKPLNRKKLKQFCLGFSVPIIYRNLLWKLLLDVVPVHPVNVESHQFIMEQRKTEYSDLLNAVKVMKLVDNNTPKSQVFLVMWLLHTGKLTIDINLAANKEFISIAQSFMQFFDDDVDVYWLSKNFYAKVIGLQKDIGKLTSISHNILEKEEPILYKHLHKNQIIDHLPLKTWFNSCFAGILNESALGKIWDKFVCGSSMIMVFVVVVLLINLKTKLLKCTELNEALVCLKEVPDEISDVIANKSIDMWQQYGSPLNINDKLKQ